MSTISKKFEKFNYKENELQVRIIDILKKINKWKDADLTTLKFERLGGLANKNYKLNINNELYLLKIPHEAVLSPEIDRKIEANNLIRLANFELTPEVFLSDISGIQVRKFIQGNPLNTHKHNISDLSAVFKKLHSLGPFLSNQTDLEKILLTYVREIEKKGGTFENEYMNIFKCVQVALNRVKELKIPITACHHDAHSGNCLIVDQQAVLLDWEFSGNYYPHYDIGYLFMADNFDIRDQRTFLMSYFQHDLDPKDVDLVNIFHYVARFMIATRMKFLTYEPTEIDKREIEKLFFENLAKLKDPDNFNCFLKVIDRI